MNNRERKLWIDNDEWLYKQWCYSSLSVSRFIAEHRVEIDAYIAQKVQGKAAK